MRRVRYEYTVCVLSCGGEAGCDSWVYPVRLASPFADLLDGQAGQVLRECPGALPAESSFDRRE